MFSDAMCDATEELSDLKELVPSETLAILDKFNDGYLTGYHWPDAWKYRPGGPWVHSCSSRSWHYGKERDNCKSCAMAKQSVAEHAAWMKGWDLGHAKKLAEGRSNPVPSSDDIRASNANERRSALYV